MAYRGRGGAGNLASTPITNSPSSSTPATKDLEANHPDPEKHTVTRTDPHTYADTHIPPPTDPGHDFERKERSAYAHMGRGGAGNLYSPRELAARGRFEGAGTSHVVGDGTPAPDSGSTEAGVVPRAESRTQSGLGAKGSAATTEGKSAYLSLIHI